MAEQRPRGLGSADRAAARARAGRRRSLPPPSALRAECGAGPGDDLVGSGARARSATSSTARRRRTARSSASTTAAGTSSRCPGPDYCDTTGERGATCWYAVASVVAPEAERSRASSPSRSQARPLADEPPRRSSARVRADRPAGGSSRVVAHDRLGAPLAALLGRGGRAAGRSASDVRAGVPARARAELGAERVRAHAILHDELGVVPRGGRRARLRLLGRRARVRPLLETGLRPVVELSFMPRALAADPDATIFEYRGHHLAAARLGPLGRAQPRGSPSGSSSGYGIDEVARWGFEIWNEANLEVFWSGTQDEYFRLYEVAARAIKAVDERLLVGGPVDRGGRLDRRLPRLRRRERRAARLRLDAHVRQPAARRRAEALRVARRSRTSRSGGPSGASTPTHFNPITDAVFGAPFVLHGMKSVAGPRRRARLLGRQRPLRGARPAAGAPARRLRPADRRQPAQAALVGARARRGARRRPASSSTCTATAPARSSTAGRRAPRRRHGRRPALERHARPGEGGRRPAARPDGPDRVRRARRRAVRVASRASTRSTRTSPAAATGRRDWPTPSSGTSCGAADRLDEEQLGVGKPRRTPRARARLPMPGVARVRLEPA